MIVIIIVTTWAASEAVANATSRPHTVCCGSERGKEAEYSCRSVGKNAAQSCADKVYSFYLQHNTGSTLLVGYGLAHADSGAGGGGELHGPQ